MPLTQYARDQLLQYGFVTTVLTRPTVWYAAAFSGFPGDTGTSISNELTSGAEPGYARIQLTGGNALALTSHIIQNGGAATWTATGNWGAAATYFGVADAASAGNLWSYDPISQGGSTYFLAAAQIAALGSGYAANDVLTLTGGGGATLTVDAVATVGGVAGIITDFHVTAAAHGSLSSIPANPLAHTGGTGTGATFLGTWLVAPQSFTLNNGDSLSLASGQIQITMA